MCTSISACTKICGSFVAVSLGVSVGVASVQPALAERGVVTTHAYTLEWAPLDADTSDATRSATELAYTSLDGGFSTAYTVTGNDFFVVFLEDDYALSDAIGGQASFTQFRFAGGVATPNTVIHFAWDDPDGTPNAPLTVNFPQAGLFGYTVTLPSPLRQLDRGRFRLAPGTSADNGGAGGTQMTWVTSASAPSVGENDGAPGVGDGFASGTVWAFEFTVEARCNADFTGDGLVDGADLGVLLGLWGDDAFPADLNGNGVVDGADLGLLLGEWGPCP